MPIQLKKVRKTIGGVIDGSEYYVSAINDETISTEDLCHYVNDTCTLSPADVVAFLEAYKNLFSKEIAHGNKLELAGIGTFIPIFGGKGGYDDTNPFRKKDLVLKRINVKSGCAYLLLMKLKVVETKRICSILVLLDIAFR